MLEGLAAKLIAFGIGALLVFGAGFALATKLDEGSYQKLKTEFADYQALVAKSEAETRSRDLDDAKRLAAAQQAALNAANARAAEAERARAAAAQALHDLLSKEGKSDAALGLCLARKLPADVVQQLAH